MISSRSTAPLLKNRTEFPSFVRTVPSEEFAATLYTIFCNMMGWRKVALIYLKGDA